MTGWRRSYPGAVFEPDYRLPAGAKIASGTRDRQHRRRARSDVADVAAAMAVRGHLELTGPVVVDQLADRCGLAPSRVQVGLARLEAEGFAMRGRFDPRPGHRGTVVCPASAGPHPRLHPEPAAARDRARHAQDFMRFLLRWQHVAPGTRRQGRAGLLAVIDQLQGFELAAGAWEEAVLPARVEGYQHRWLEDLCLAGEVSWGRLSLRPPEADGQTATGSVDAVAGHAGDLRPARGPALAYGRHRGDAVPDEPVHGAGRDVLDALRTYGAMFSSDLPAATRRLPIEVQEGLWDLVARGIVTADGFGAVRSLFSRRDNWARRHLPERRRIGLRPSPANQRGLRRPGEGRWALLATAAYPGALDMATDELAEQVAGQLLARWGVVFWDLAAREDLAVPWREILWALRRFEARGLVRGGRFVTGFAGEQYALPEAVDELRHVRRSQRKGELVRLSAADPLNLSGIVLAGKRVPAVRTNSILFRDGLIVPATGGDGAEAPHVAAEAAPVG